MLLEHAIKSSISDSYHTAAPISLDPPPAIHQEKVFIPKPQAQEHSRPSTNQSLTPQVEPQQTFGRQHSVVLFSRHFEEEESCD
jgi:hypothetical protein